MRALFRMNRITYLFIIALGANVPTVAKAGTYTKSFSCAATVRITPSTGWSAPGNPFSIKAAVQQDRLSCTIETPSSGILLTGNTSALSCPALDFQMEQSGWNSSVVNNSRLTNTTLIARQVRGSQDCGPYTLSTTVYRYIVPGRGKTCTVSGPTITCSFLN